MALDFDTPYNAERFIKALTETIVWCSRYAVADEPENSLRTFAPEYSLLISRYEQVLSVLTQRKKRLEKDGLLDLKPATDLAGGRLLAYIPDYNLTDGAATAESLHFLDWDNCPPVDTWVCLTQATAKNIWPNDARSDILHDCLIAWIPPVFLELANGGIEVNPEECVKWLDTLNTPFVESLRKLKFLE